jgi:broad specificity phosphatase PhoE
MANPSTITFIRHADVENPENIFYGRMRGYGLSEVGRREAARTAAVLAEEPVSAIYTSPMLRARQTARIIAEPHRLRPRATWLLAEVKTGWQGRPFAELDMIGFDFYSRPLSPSEETLHALWVRIQRFARKVREEHPGGTVLAVTHGDIAMVARAGFLGMPISIGSIRLPNVYAGKGSLTRVHFNPVAQKEKPVIEYYDPNGDDPRWASAWVRLNSRGARVD